MQRFGGILGETHAALRTLSFRPEIADVKKLRLLLVFAVLAGSNAWAVPEIPDIDRDALLGVIAEIGELIWIDPEDGDGNFAGSTIDDIEALAKSPISSILYGGNYSEGAANLYEISELGGSADLVGPLGENVLGMLAADFDADGTLYAVIEVFGEGEECPFEECEEECPEGECECPFGECECEYYEECDEEYLALATIDLVTGEADIVGKLFVDDIEGISFDGTGTLWGVSRFSDALYQISLETGAADFITGVFVGEGSPIPAGGFRSLQFACDDTPFDGELGTLYAGLGQSEGGGGRVYTIDPETGQASLINEGSVTGGNSLTGLALHTTCGETISNAPVLPGTNRKTITVDVFEQVAANVVVGGETDAFFCVVPDTRWRKRKNGSYRFRSRNLKLSSLSGQGTCTGPLVPGEPETWESDIFPNLNLTVAAWYRSYKGRITLPGDTEPTEGHWFVLGVVRTTAEFDGPVSYVTFPEALIDYSATDPNEIPACDTDLAFRNLDIAGAVPAFGDFPNFEGNRMIVQSAQCNRTRSITRRTTHIYPVRYEYPKGGSNAELVNLLSQLSGISGTVSEAASCADPSLIADIQSSVMSAQMAIMMSNFGDAEQDLEEVARSAQNAEDFGTGFAGCDIERNYRGTFVSRGITAAFTVHDRFEHPNDYQKYFVPADLNIPILDQEFIVE